MTQQTSQVYAPSKQDLMKVRNAKRNKVNRDDSPKPRRPPHTPGKKTRLGIINFLFVLFWDNEVMPRQKKLTDTALEDRIAEEFPFTDRHDARYNGWWEGYAKSLNNLRGMYNRGALSNGIKPEHFALRYNKDGYPISTRADRILTKEEVSDILDHYEEYWLKKEAQREKIDEEAMSTHD